MNILQIAKNVLKTEGEELIRNANLLDENFEKAVQLALECKGKVVVTGVGKSGHIGQKIAATLASTGTPSFFLHPTEAMHGDLGMIATNDIVLAISFSGESSELLAILPHIKRREVKIIAMSKNGSTLAKGATVNLDLNIVCEACPLGAAPTVSTTLTLALGDALAVSLMQMRGFRKEDFAAFHPGGSLGKRLFLKVEDVMKTELPLVSEDANLKDAINVMTKGKLGSVLLVDKNGVLSALLTDGDLRRALSNEAFRLNAPALDFATKSPKVLQNRQILAYEALHITKEHKIQLLVVVDEFGRPVGVLHLHDLVNLGL